MRENILSIPSKGGYIYDVYFDRKGHHILYNKDNAGDEKYQFYLYDAGAKKSIQLTYRKSRNVEPVWSRCGDQWVWGSTPEGGTGMELHVINPFKSDTLKRLVPTSGKPLEAYDWSPADRQIVYVEFVSLKNESNCGW